MNKLFLLRLVSMSITAAILFSCGGQLLAAETAEADEAFTWSRNTIESTADTDETFEGLSGDVSVEGYIDFDFDNNYLAEQYIINNLSPNRQAYKGTYDFESALSGYNLTIYRYLLPKIQAVAAGTETSTMFMIPEDVLTITIDYSDFGFIRKNDDSAMKSAISNALAEAGFDVDLILDALLYSCPYDLYWFDKTKGFLYDYKWQIDTVGSVQTVKVYGFSFRFPVVEDYRAGNSIFNVDPKYGQAVASARDNVSRIIASNADKDDYSKLRAYADTICDMVDYNEAAGYDDSMPYGNPWQLIWIFDGDDSTEVVCEGYSKGFHYLCDNTDFDDDSIYAIDVYGDVYFSNGSGGGHMWSLVHMDDGKNYHVDVTFMDDGYDYFLKGATKQTGNAFWIENEDKYVYDQYFVEYFGMDALTLATDDYVYTGPTEKYKVELGNAIKNCSPELSASVAVVGKTVTVTVNPVEGYEFDYITVNGATYKVPEFTMPAEDVVVNVYCKKIDYKITCAESRNGKVTTNTSTANVGDVITITVTPADGYELKSITVKDSDGNAVAVKADNTFEMPASAVTVSAVFKKTGVEPGWAQEGDGWYYYLEDGSLATGWLKVGAWYYFDENGVMQTGWQKIDGVWYCFRNSGSMYSGEWLKWGNKWYYLKDNGAMATGWFQVGGTWYLFNGSGAMLTGWQQVNGKWYYLEPSGAMKTGWLSSGGKWYYLNASGDMATGWVKAGDYWYYMDPSTGAMVTGILTIDGKRYRFADDGHCLNRN